MKRYDHYSFDLWGTLIKSNPEFKENRDKFIWNLYDGMPDCKSLEQVSTIISRTGQQFNCMAEQTSYVGQISNMSLMMWMCCISEITNYTCRPDQAEGIKNEIDRLFLKYPPLLYEEKTVEVLTALKQRGATLSILSNTGFIQGSVLVEFLCSIGIDHLFDFALFSDQIECSKPSTEAFYMLYRDIKFGKSVIHVGDSQIADVDGATAFANSYRYQKILGSISRTFDSLLVNSNGVSIQTLLQ